MEITDFDKVSCIFCWFGVLEGNGLLKKLQESKIWLLHDNKVQYMREMHR